MVVLFQVLDFCCKPIPVYNNLIHLTIQTDRDVEWESLTALLKNCPNIETLVFEVTNISSADISYPNKVDEILTLVLFGVF